MQSRRIIFASLLVLLFVGAFRIPTSTIQVSPLEKSRAVVLPIPALGQICDGALYLQDVTIPDGTKIKPNTAFIKKWAVKNIGTCGWNKRYSLQFEKGDQMSGEDIYLERWIAPGKTTVLSVGMISPSTEGAYTGYWVMKNGDDAPISSSLTVKIVVKKKIP